jgi:hypothetical protein
MSPIFDSHGKVMRIALSGRHISADTIMAYAKTQGAVRVRQDGKLVFRLVGLWKEPMDITEDTLRSYLDPAGTCARNNAEAAKTSAVMSG